MERLLRLRPTQVTPHQLNVFLQNPNKNSLVQSAQILSQEIPRRLALRWNALNSLPKRIVEEENVNRSLQKFHKIALDFGSIGFEFKGFSDSQMEIFKQHAYSLQDQLDESWSELNTNLRDFLKEANQSGKIHQDQSLINQLLDHLLTSLISLRVLLSQHHKAFEKFQSKDSEEENIAGNIITKFDLIQVIESTMEESQALCVDKFGISPPLELQFGSLGRKTMDIIAAESHVHFIVMELLKNSMKAMIDLHSIDADSAAPIVLLCSSQKGQVGFEVRDEGGGMSDLSRTFDFFHTTEVPATPTYTYSGSFGVPFVGEGVGLPSARCYSRFLGGELTLGTLPGIGTSAFVLLPQWGQHPLPS